jgi:predicted RNase H-like HicB family nuclease
MSLIMTMIEGTNPGETMKRAYSVIIEKDEDGYFVATVPELPGCHSQAKSLDELSQRIKEAIALYLEVTKDATPGLHFVGIQQVEV